MASENRYDRRTLLKTGGAAIGSASLAGCTSILGDVQDGGEGYAAERGREAACDLAGRREDLEDRAENDSVVQAGQEVVDTIEEQLIDPIVGVTAPLRAAYEFNRERMQAYVRQALQEYPEAGRDFGFWVTLWGEPTRTNLDIDDTVVGLERYENATREANTRYVIIKLQTSSAGNYADLTPNRHLPVVEGVERWFRDVDLRARFKPIAETVVYHAIDFYVDEGTDARRRAEFREAIGHIRLVIGGVYGGYVGITIDRERVEAYEQGIATGAITGPEDLDLAYDELGIDTEDCLSDALDVVNDASNATAGG